MKKRFWFLSGVSLVRADPAITLSKDYNDYPTYVSFTDASQPWPTADIYEQCLTTMSTLFMFDGSAIDLLSLLSICPEGSMLSDDECPSHYYFGCKPVDMAKYNGLLYGIEECFLPLYELKYNYEEVSSPPTGSTTVDYCIEACSAGTLCNDDTELVVRDHLSCTLTSRSCKWLQTYYDQYQTEREEMKVKTSQYKACQEMMYVVFRYLLPLASDANKIAGAVCLAKCTTMTIDDCPDGNWSTCLANVDGCSSLKAAAVFQKTLFLPDVDGKPYADCGQTLLNGLESIPVEKLMDDDIQALVAECNDLCLSLDDSTCDGQAWALCVAQHTADPDCSSLVTISLPTTAGSEDAVTTCSYYYAESIALFPSALLTDGVSDILQICYIICQHFNATTCPSLDWAQCTEDYSSACQRYSKTPALIQDVLTYGAASHVTLFSLLSLFPLLALLL